jgi:hypothetical protein
MLRRSLRGQVRGTCARVTAVFASPTGSILRELIAESLGNDDIAEQFRQRFFTERLKRGMPTFEAGIAQGELRADLDLDVVSEMLYAPLWLRLIIGHRPLTPAVADQILDHAWPILATDPTSTTLGARPRYRHTEPQWTVHCADRSRHASTSVPFSKRHRRTDGSAQKPAHALAGRGRQCRPDRLATSRAGGRSQTCRYALGRQCWRHSGCGPGTKTRVRVRLRPLVVVDVTTFAREFLAQRLGWNVSIGSGEMLTAQRLIAALAIVADALGLNRRKCAGCDPTAIVARRVVVVADDQCPVGSGSPQPRGVTGRDAQSRAGT